RAAQGSREELGPRTLGIGSKLVSHRVIASLRVTRVSRFICVLSPSWPSSLLPKGIGTPFGWPHCVALTRATRAEREHESNVRLPFEEGEGSVRACAVPLSQYGGRRGSSADAASAWCVASSMLRSSSSRGRGTQAFASTRSPLRLRSTRPRSIAAG